MNNFLTINQIPLLITILIVAFCVGYVIIRMLVFGIVKSFFEAKHSYYRELKKKLNKGE